MSLIGIIASSKLGVVPPVPGYTAWYDAADTGTITQVSGAVSQWNDKSANGYNLVQATATNKPTSGTRTKNSLNVIDFDGTNDFMQANTAASVWNFMHNTTGATIFFVWQPDVINKFNWIMDTTNSDGLGSAGYGASIHQQTTTGVLYHSVNNGSGSTATAPVRNSDGGTVAASTYYYVTLKSDQNNATAADRSKFKLNGGADAGNNTNTGTPSATNASQALVIGAQAPGAFEPLNGTIGEIIIYPGILSATNITINQNYLAAKWAI